MKLETGDSQDLKYRVFPFWEEGGGGRRVVVVVVVTVVAVVTVVVVVAGAGVVVIVMVVVRTWCYTRVSVLSCARVHPPLRLD